MQSTTPMHEEDKLSDIYGMDRDDALFLDCLTEHDIEEEQLAKIIKAIKTKQHNIDDAAENARLEIAKERRQLDYLLWKWMPVIQLLKQKCAQGQKTLRFGSCGMVRFEKTGGYEVSDRTQLFTYLNTLSDDELRKFGAVRTIQFQSKDVLKHLRDKEKAEGRKFLPPGTDWVDINEYGKVKVGATNPWSPYNLKKMLNRALSGKDNSEDETDSGEDS